MNNEIKENTGELSAEDQQKVKSLLKLTYSFISISSIIVVILICFLIFGLPKNSEENKVATIKEEHIENGIDVASGLVASDGYQVVRQVCTSCHSSKQITSNRATREGWFTTIRWMQKTQKLWDLGKNEELILDYLEKNYSPENKGRRQQLTEVDWYVLKN